MRRRLTIRLAVLGVLLFWAVLLTASYCEDQREEIVPAGGLWCGDALCGWRVEIGQVKRVATWHTKDYGVSLVGPEAAIAQTTEPDVAGCFSFEVIAEHDADVKLTIEVDFLADAVVDYTHPIPSSDWQPEVFEIDAPYWVRQMRIVARKVGDGRAVLGRLNVWGEEFCQSEPIAMTDLPDGAPCTLNSVCRSQQCASLVSESSHFDNPTGCCSCTAHQQCPSGTVCGVTSDSPDLGVYLACVAPGSRVLGDRCRFDEECATGICHRDLCATCTEDPQCEYGQGCKPADQTAIGPNQCAPGEGLGQPDDPCLNDADCMSSHCDSAEQLSICELDGRRCQADPDCPLIRDGLGGWESTACLAIGHRGGRCR